MAATATPFSGFDFPLFGDFSTSACTTEPDLFLNDENSNIMSYQDQNAFSQYFTSVPEQRTSHSAYASSAPRGILGSNNANDEKLHPSNRSLFAQGHSIVSSGSDTGNSLQSSTSSTMGSPYIQGTFAAPFNVAGSNMSGGYSELMDQAFDSDQFSQTMAEQYQALVAGDRGYGFVGESHDFSLMPNQPQSQYQPLSVPSTFSRVDPSPFKKPHSAFAQASRSSTNSTNSPTGVLAPPGNRHYPSWPVTAPTTPATFSPVNPPILRSTLVTSAAASPRTPMTAIPDWTAATETRRGSVMPERLIFASPAFEQEPLNTFQSSPFSMHSHFFHQSSGNYVAPLESSYPSLLQPAAPSPSSITTSQYPVPQPIASPALSQASSHAPSRTSSLRMKSPRSQSPLVQNHSWQPYPTSLDRRGSTRHFTNVSSRSDSVDLEDSERENRRCPHPGCGRVLKDLKAHMLTHQNERPEKCPIPNCEYNKKGFSRKYDKNRHTLTHYKGTMVCGFCPHSGSSAEKSFNRADVFKRHLTTVHGVEQNPPNSRKKPIQAATRSTQTFAGDATGKCSICSCFFATAQDFYEHLEDCVLNVVQKVDPRAAINERLLASVSESQEVKNSLARSHPSTAFDDTAITAYGSAGDDDDDDRDEENDNNISQSSDLFFPASRNPRPGKGSIRSTRNESS